MSDPPPLPESDDPFVVLGVERGCGEAALKAAYARLLRIYRPDRAPREFRRVQAAFEAARAGATTFRPPAPSEHSVGGARATVIDAGQIEQKLADGDLDAALAVVNRPAFDRAADSDPALRALAFRVACAAAWERPDDAEAIHHRHGHHDFKDWWEAVYDDRRGLAAAWAKWRRRHRRPPWLPRLLQYSDSLRTDDLARFVPHPCGRPGPLLRAFDRMDKCAPRLLVVCTRGLGDDAPGGGDLAADQLRAATRLRRRLGVSLRTGRVARIIVWSYFVMITAGIGLLNLTARNRKRAAALRYHYNVRPTLLNLVRRHDVAPSQFAAWLRTHHPRSAATRYADAIDHDLPLQATWNVLHL